MSNIATYIAQISSAIYGPDVRGAIVNALLAMNADLEDAIDDQIVQISADSPITSSDDLNDFTSAGVWAWMATSVPSNAPTQRNGILFVVRGTSANFVGQIVWGYQSDLYWRKKLDGTWYDWQQAATQAGLDELSAAFTMEQGWTEQRFQWAEEEKAWTNTRLADLGCRGELPLIEGDLQGTTRLSYAVDMPAGRAYSLDIAGMSTESTELACSIVFRHGTSDVMTQTINRADFPVDLTLYPEEDVDSVWFLASNTLPHSQGYNFEYHNARLAAITADDTLTRERAYADAKAVGDALGDLDTLETEDKSSLVAAINELAARLDALS
ncbi:MAG: hypothetical protein IKD79_00490 [Oscillospiraceae bacterium]|nr:hypothetical protein [Oscillospiraceae bacterium]